MNSASCRSGARLLHASLAGPLQLLCRASALLVVLHRVLRPLAAEHRTAWTSASRIATGSMECCVWGNVRCGSGVDDPCGSGAGASAMWPGAGHRIGVAAKRAGGETGHERAHRWSSSGWRWRSPRSVCVPHACTGRTHRSTAAARRAQARGHQAKPHLPHDLHFVESPPLVVPLPMGCCFCARSNPLGKDCRGAVARSVVHVSVCDFELAGLV